MSDDTHNKLLAFVGGMTRLVSRSDMAEGALLDGADELMRTLVSSDDWLPHSMAVPHPQYYQQHLLYGDPLNRFSVISFVWGPGQGTPVHDHQVWGVIGMLRGAEFNLHYEAPAVGVEGGALACSDREQRLDPGRTTRVSPSIGDIHRVRNAYDDRVSISIHVYGGNIGRVRRHVFDPTTGKAKEFISGYSNAVVPNLWPPAGTR